MLVAGARGSVGWPSRARVLAVLVDGAWPINWLDGHVLLIRIYCHSVFVKFLPLLFIAIGSMAASPFDIGLALKLKKTKTFHFLWNETC